MDTKIFVAGSLFILSFLLLPVVAGAACGLVSSKTYYTDGVSFFKDAACRQEMTAAEMNAGTAAASTASGYISTGNGNCRYSLAKKQYTDGVSFFTDNKCTKEALNDEAVSAPTALSVGAQTQTLAPAQASVAAAVSSQADQRIAALENKFNLLLAMVSQILTLIAKR